MPVDTDRLLQTYLSSGSYKNPGRCSNDILNAIKHYRGLTPRFDKFIFNDGSQKDLICLGGTIPVPYRGANYNIPVSIWVLDTHPLHAPMCFVCPTTDMQVRVSRHVDYNGKVYLPYLHEWNEANSDLLGLVQVCIITFSEQPPVFAKAGQQQQPPQHPGYPPPNMSTGGGGYPPYPSNSGYPPYPQQQQQQQQQQSSAISQEYIKASLVSAVEEKVRRLLREDYHTKQVEVESLRKIKDDLQTSQNTNKAMLDSINGEIARLAELSPELTRRKSELEAARESVRVGQESNIDDVVQVVYPLYNQLLNAYAEDASIDDAIYFLGEALRLGVIDCDNFLKNSRNISRKQFFLRLTELKCRGKAKLEGGL